MKTITPSTRARLEMQGFAGLDDAALADIRPWLRVSPALTLVWMAVGLLLGSAQVIWAMIPVALLGALLPNHPFDVFYNFGIRFVTGTRALPSYRFARRLCCLVVSVWASLTGWAFASGATTAGYILGCLFIGGALLPVLFDFCIPSYVYSVVLGMPAACSPRKIKTRAITASDERRLTETLLWKTFNGQKRGSSDRQAAAAQIRVENWRA